MISFVRDMWSYGTHLPIYHSDYLFPYTVPPPPPLSLPRSSLRTSSLILEGTPSATTLARMNDSLGINNNQEFNQGINQDIDQGTGTEMGMGSELGLGRGMGKRNGNGKGKGKYDNNPRI